MPPRKLGFYLWQEQRLVTSSHPLESNILASFWIYNVESRIYLISHIHDVQMLQWESIHLQVNFSGKLVVCFRLYNPLASIASLERCKLPEESSWGTHGAHRAWSPLCTFRMVTETNDSGRVHRSPCCTTDGWRYPYWVLSTASLVWAGMYLGISILSEV